VQKTFIPGRAFAVLEERSRGRAELNLKAAFPFFSPKSNPCDSARYARLESTTPNCPTYNYFRACSDFHPGSFAGEGLRIGVQMIAQRLGRTITEPAIEQLFDESLIDELEKDGFLKASE
jgi:hypothetical protein